MPPHREAEMVTVDLDHLDQTDLGDLQELCRVHGLDVGGNCVALRARLRTVKAAVTQAAGSQQDDVVIDEEGPAKKKATADTDHPIKVGSHVGFKNVTYKVASVFGGAAVTQLAVDLAVAWESCRKVTERHFPGALGRREPDSEGYCCTSLVARSQS